MMLTTLARPLLFSSFSTMMYPNLVINPLVINPAYNLSRFFTHIGCTPRHPQRAFSPLQSISSRSCCSRMLSTSTSSSAGATLKNEYLVIVPDHPNSLQTRLSLREKHLENVKPHVQAGSVLLGGSILSRHPKEGEQPDMVGSAMVIKAESEEAVREWLAADIYAKGGAWNVNEAKIYPFRSVVRTAM